MFEGRITLRGVLWCAAWLAVLFWIVHNPTGAGHEVADLFNTVVGWFRAVLTAVLAFGHSVVK